MNIEAGVAHPPSHSHGAAGRAAATEEPLGRFAVKGVFWRQYLDWAAVNLPFFFYPVNVFFFTIFFFFPKGYGVPLPGVYALWAVVIVVLYPFCRWMAAVKALRRDWWLSYV